MQLTLLPCAVMPSCDRQASVNVSFRILQGTKEMINQVMYAYGLNRWCIVGMQGALLSHLVEPIYLHSLTVGTLCHTGHLARGMARRLTPVKHLPLPYRRQQLLLACRSKQSPETIKPASCSI